MASTEMTRRQRWTLVAVCLAIPVLGIAVKAGTLGEFLLVVGTGAASLAVLAGLIRLGRVLMSGRRWLQPPRFLDEPIPPDWVEIVHETFPLSRRLDELDQNRLMRYVQLFIHEKRFEGCNGLVITDQIRVNIAAQACYLLLRLEAGCYPDLTTVLVYPQAYVPKDDTLLQTQLQTGQVQQPQGARLGESWLQGTVVLSWDAATRGAANIRDGRNVVFHEFAHRLDQQDGVADGVPAALPASSIQTWAAVVGKHQERLKRARKCFRRTVLQKYGATNRAEFFAVATEAFFEKPQQLRKKAPDLYVELVEFYGRDPAENFFLSDGVL